MNYKQNKTLSCYNVMRASNIFMFETKWKKSFSWTNWVNLLFCIFTDEKLKNLKFRKIIPEKTFFHQFSLERK